MQSKFVKSVMASLLSLALCVPESIPSSAVPPTVAPILLKEKVGNVAEPVVRRRMAGGRGHAGRSRGGRSHAGRSHAGRSHAGRSHAGRAGNRSVKGTANRSRSHKGTANRNANRNTNRNVNRNTNRNVNRNVNTRYSGWTRGHAWNWHGWARPIGYSWAPGAAIAAGAAIGWVSAATAYAWAGAPPATGMCWYYTDASRTHGFWDVCE
jgi:hypothetical protein